MPERMLQIPPLFEKLLKMSTSTASTSTFTSTTPTTSITEEKHSYEETSFNVQEETIGKLYSSRRHDVFQNLKLLQIIPQAEGH